MIRRTMIARTTNPIVDASIISPRIVRQANGKRDFDQLPFLEYEEDGGEDKGESYQIVPLQTLFEIKHRKRAEDNECDHFLRHLQLGRRELIMADAVGRYLKAIFWQRDQPAYQNDFPKN